jgi:serine/threonine-protein kinase
MTTPPPPPGDDNWPTRETDVLVPSTEETVVAEPPPPHEPDSRIGWGMVLGILAVGLAAAAIAAVWWFTRDDDGEAAPTTTTQVTTTVAASRVAVPDVRGMTVAQARTQLEAGGFETQQTEVISDERAGTVVDQSPDAGTKAAKGATVTLGVAKGESTTTTGSTTTTEETTTEETTTQATTTAPTAPATVPVPDLTGTQLAGAVRRLAGDGLLASVQYIPGDEPLGTIRTQAPPAGRTARSHSHVTLNASSGPGDKEQKTVPDTTGQTLDQAVSTLNDAGLRLIFVKLPVTDRAQAGKVVEQTPAAGKSAPENAQAVVYLGAFRG